MTVQSGQSVTVLFSTRVFSTGVGSNADSLPTGALYKNGTLNGATVTVTNITTGLYKAQVTLPTLAIADQVEIAITATVSTITDSAIIWGDVNDLIVDGSGDVTFNNTSITTVTGNVNGSVASVTGAVGSVTGNVGGSVASVTGNVGGSVASVTGAVGSVAAAVAITSNLKQNQALAGFQFLMTDSTNHNPLTGATITATRSLNGAAFSATANSATEISNGWYTINLAATDLNAKTVALRFTATGADDRDIQLITQV
jgi:hypothetical protein